MIIEFLILGASICFAGMYIGHCLLEGEMPEYVNNDSDEEVENNSFIDEQEFGSEQLHRTNAEFDERIKNMMEELQRQPGVIYEEDHSIVDKRYIPIPPEEYAK